MPDARRDHTDESSKTESLADRFIRLACLNYLDDHTHWRDEARKIFAAQPSLSGKNIYTAATTGDVAALTRMLSADHRLANARGGPYNWEPLLYAAYSRLDSDMSEHSTLEVARILLNHGADPNAGYLWDGHYVFTALTGAFGEGESGPINQAEHKDCYKLARLLLEAGANPNDSQTLYNRMFTGGTKHLELLFEFGLGKERRTGAWFEQLGLLVSPSEMLQQQMGWAAKYNQMERLCLLVDHGADINTPDSRLKRTPYDLAIRNGNVEIAQYLLDHGAQKSSLSELDAFAAARINADRDRARSMLQKDPTLIDRLGEERTELLNRAAESNKLEAIRLMAELGFDLNEVRRTAPLHLAAAGPHLEMVKLLIERGADPLVRDQEFNATPMGWARYNHQTEVAEYLQRYEPQERKD